jgi:hypothetical protein
MDIANLNWPGYLPRLLWIRRVCPRCSSFEFKEAESHPFDGPLGLFCAAPGSLCQLLAALLLVCTENRN